MRQVRSHALARVTSKGQVTIPAEVRKALAIEQGDDLVFDLGPDRTAQLRVIKRKSLSGLYGALPATRSYPGTKEIREEVGQALGQRAKVQGS
jgi:AbrB family looped-hinge helix DNA binding protein